MAETLLLDLGNSSLKWAFAHELPGFQRLDWRGGAISALLDGHWAGLERPGAVVASSVAPRPVTEALGRWIRERWQLPLQLVSAAHGWPGLRCAYPQPETLGADRWAAMVAAHERYPAGSLVVDCGTAITLDAIANGRHLGGYILPGIRAMQAAVTSRTAIDADIDEPVEGWGWGRNTAQCLALGTTAAVASLVEESLERLQRAGVCDPVLVVTGGQCGLLLPLIQVDYRRHDALVLEGVRLCSRRTLE